MKFTNGMWLDKEDCKISYPSEAYSVDIVDNCLVIYAPYVKVTHKGNTTDGGLMTIRISSPASDVISVSMTNHAGSRAKKAAFPLNTRRMSSEVFETETHYVLASGGTEAHVAKAPPSRSHSSLTVPNVVVRQIDGTYP